MLLKPFSTFQNKIKINICHLFIFYKYRYTAFLFHLVVVYCRYGVLAQLGARNIRIVEATGSNPVYSTARKAVRNLPYPVNRGMAGFLYAEYISAYIVKQTIIQHEVQYEICPGDLRFWALLLQYYRLLHHSSSFLRKLMVRYARLVWFRLFLWL